MNTQVNMTKSEIIRQLEAAVQRSGASQLNEAVWILGDRSEHNRIRDARSYVLGKIRRCSDSDLEELAKVYIDQNCYLYRGNYYVSG